MTLANDFFNRHISYKEFAPYSKYFDFQFLYEYALKIKIKCAQFKWNVFVRIYD